MGRRLDGKAGDIDRLLGESRVAGELDAAPATRREAVRVPDLLHRRDGASGCLLHGARGPGRRLVRRRLGR
ncbi:MAG: hypothetical protein AAGA32_09580, partial [Pseudomonadota bacterium]